MSDDNDSNETAETVLDAIGGAAGGAASLLPEDGEAGQAREALEAVSSAAKIASGAAKAGRGVADLAGSRDAGSAASSVGSIAGGAGGIARAVGNRDVERAANVAGSVARAAGQVARGVEELAGNLGAHADVEYHLEISGVDGRWAVHSIEFEESLNEPFELAVEALVAQAHPEAADLLGKDCTLALERPSHQRSFKGIVRKARVRERHDGVHVRLVVVPALWYLGENRDSRIYQDKTYPEIIEELYRRQLGGRSREVRNDLTRTYPTHEYVTQYEESDLAFLTRLCEQESFFYFFDHEEGDHEVFVLADATSGLQSVHEEAVRFWHDADQVPGGEAVFAAHHSERVGATDVVVSEYNWTRPSSPVRGEQTARGEGDPPLEDYDHLDAVALYDYSSRAYGGNDATLQAQMRAERLDLDRQSWSMRSTVVAAQPGKLLELSGCPDGALDGRRYLIVSIHGSGEATEGVSGSYDNAFDCVPVDVPYRPARRTPRPVVLGPETAVVVGPAGEEIHTDEHGRVKVQFHWDRQGQRDERSSCWLRTAQMWGGPSWGTWFLPRIGMEVIVQFLGGNPDRPFVAGCLYNGENHTPYPLPDEKTKSTIKTNSSPTSGGYNELRFEDKAGREEVYLQAQKDFNELVKNNHATTVRADQTNTVHGNQTETVHKEQTMTVHRDRFKTIKQNEFTEITQNRTENVHGAEDVFIEATRSHVVKMDESLVVQQGKRTVTVETGKDSETYKGGRETTVLQFDNLKVDEGANKNTHVTGQYNIKVDDHLAINQGGTEKLYLHGKGYWESADKVQVIVPGCELELKSGGEAILNAKSKFTVTCGKAAMELSSDGTIKLKGVTLELSGAGGSALKLDGSAALLKGAKVDALADTFVTIRGIMVRIN